VPATWDQTGIKNATKAQDRANWSNWCGKGDTVEWGEFVGTLDANQYEVM